MSTEATSMSDEQCCAALCRMSKPTRHPKVEKYRVKDDIKVGPRDKKRLDLDEKRKDLT